MHSQAVTDAGAELVRLAQSIGLMRGETVAVDGSEFRAVSSAPRVREGDAVKRYLEQLDTADAQDEVLIDARAVQAALEKLKNDPEPEARFMRAAKGSVPTYNVQTAVDTEHALIVVQQVTDEATDNRSWLSMAEAAKAALGNPETLHLVADAGYSSSARRKGLSILLCKRPRFVLGFGDGCAREGAAPLP
jgi:Transposase DDE domain